CGFFFSSRRRHTRFSRDWSSDVCSSDLDASRINEQDINSAYLSGNIAEGTIDVDLMLSVPEGDTRLIATVQPFLDEPTYTVREEIGRASCGERVWRSGGGSSITSGPRSR